MASDDSIARLKSAAEAYVALIDAAQAKEREQLLFNLAGVLPMLYEAGLRRLTS